MFLNIEQPYHFLIKFSVYFTLYKEWCSYIRIFDKGTREHFVYAAIILNYHLQGLESQVNCLLIRRRKRIKETKNDWSVSSDSYFEVESNHCENREQHLEHIESETQRTLPLPQKNRGKPPNSAYQILKSSLVSPPIETANLRRSNRKKILCIFKF